MRIIHQRHQVGQLSRDYPLVLTVEVEESSLLKL